METRIVEFHNGYYAEVIIGDTFIAMRLFNNEGFQGMERIDPDSVQLDAALRKWHVASLGKDYILRNPEWEVDVGIRSYESSHSNLMDH